MAAVKHQLLRLASARPTQPGVSPLWALLGSQWEAWRQARLQRRAEHRMLSDLGLASTFPDKLDTQPQVYAQEARRSDA